MEEIPWVRGLRTINDTGNVDDGRWKDFLIKILLGEEIGRGDKTKKAEDGLKINPSRYWYIASFHNAFIQAAMIWKLALPTTCKEDHAKLFNCGGICKCDTGGIFDNKNPEIKNKPINEKISFFHEKSLPLSGYIEPFISDIKKTGVTDYITSNNRSTKWEGRIEITNVNTHIRLEKLFLERQARDHLFFEVDHYPPAEKKKIKEILRSYTEIRPLQNRLQLTEEIERQLKCHLN